MDRDGGSKSEIRTCCALPSVTPSQRQCARFNLALYRFAQGRSDPGALSAFASAMGLRRRDLRLGADHRGVTTVRVERDRHGPKMIPFTPRALNWHTDGYYNAPERSVRGVVMHCAAPAASGGENALLDPDLVFAAMHGQDPALVEALAHPGAMTIPAHMKPTERWHGLNAPDPYSASSIRFPAPAHALHDAHPVDTVALGLADTAGAVAALEADVRIAVRRTTCTYGSKRVKA